MPKQFLTVKEVSKLMGVTPLTVRNWDAKGKLVAHRHPVNNYRLYKVDDVENLLKEIDNSKGKGYVRQVKQEETASPEEEKPKIKKLEIDLL